MARKLVSVAAAIALLGVGTLVGSVVSTSPHAQAATKIKGYSPDNSATENTVNVRPKENEDSLGDYFVGVSPLLNRPGGKQIGNEKHQCFNIESTGVTFSALCTGTFWIEGRGKIIGSGTFKIVFTDAGPPAPSALAITGGTGEFKGARGTIKLLFKPHGITFVFNVID